MDSKLKEFFALPVAEHDSILSDEMKPLSGVGICGDDLLSATDENGVVWIRTTDGDKRMRACDFLGMA